MRKSRLNILINTVLIIGASLAWHQAGADDWPGFRGGSATGVFRGGEDIPPVLSPEKQLQWKTELPGRGPSSPIVIGNKVIVTAGVGARQDELHVLCFDAETGRQDWDFRFWATGSTVCNPFGGVAASTPVSDGKHVVALFSSNDLVCLDLEGHPLWFRGLGFERPLLRNDVGMASSPVIVDDVVIVQAESLLDAIICGLDLKTGRTRWLIDRPKQAMWCTPIVVHTSPEPGPGGTSQAVVLVQSRKDFQALSPRTGETVFAYDHWCDTVSSAAANGELVALPAAGIHALRLVPTGFERLWISDRLQCGNTSPLVWENKIYVTKPPNIFVCADGRSGEILRQLRLRGNFWASPLLVGRHVYTVNYDGTVFVLSLDEAGLPTLAGQWDLESGVLASPASDGQRLYFRTNRFLYAFRMVNSPKE